MSHSPAFSELGTYLANEARVWAIDGSPSALLMVEELDHPQTNSDGQLRVELYIFHLVAFVEATLHHGADGLSVQVALLNASPLVSQAILDSCGEQFPEEDQMRKRITDALQEYTEVLPFGGSTPEFLKFGGLAARRIFGTEQHDPIAAVGFVHMFQSARETCSNLLNRALGAVDIDD